jgi:hypothetical protein
MAHALGYVSNINSTTNASSYAASSHTPSGDCLLLAFVHNTKATLPDLPTLAGNGLTWTMVGNLVFNTAGTPLSRATLWRSLVTGTPQSGTITATFSANQTSCFIGVIQVSEPRTGGVNGASGIAQIFSGVKDTDGSPSLTGSAITATENFMVGFFANDINPFGGTAETNWFEIADVGTNNPANGSYIMYRKDTTDNTITVTRNSSDWAGFGVETRHLEEVSIQTTRRRIFLVV